MKLSNLPTKVEPKREDRLKACITSGGTLCGLRDKLGVPHLSISFPVANRAVLNRGYTGFAGGLTLAEDLLSAACGRTVKAEERQGRQSAESDKSADRSFKEEL
jgi:hypothetical protein